MKKILLTAFIGMFFVAGVIAQASLEGKMIDKDTGEPILFGTIALYKNDVLMTGGETDFDGNFSFTELEPGTYDVEGRYLGYQTQRIAGISLLNGKTERITIELSEDQGVLIDEIVVVEYKAPLIEIDNTTTGTTITAEKINSLPTKSINGLVATAAGVSSQDGATPSFRGSRTNETVYFIDGIRTFGTIPQSEVEQLQIVTGGIEAKYGDVTGGIISLTSKGPSNKFSGGFDVETSELLDGYQYNLASLNFSGPILKKGDKSILGYRVSGQYRDVKDFGPSAVGVYRAPLDVIRALEEDPIVQFNNVNAPAAELLSNEDIGGPLNARPTDGNRNINLTAKFDARISDAIDIQLSGNYIDDNNRFTPGGSGVANSGAPWFLYNWHNNPFSLTDRYRINFRFRHKLGRQNNSSDMTSEEKRASLSNIRNLYYTIQAGFERGTGTQEDFRHQDRLGDYGYLGTVDRSWVPSLGLVQGEQRVRHVGYTEMIGEFTPGEQNPVLARLEGANPGVPENGQLSTATSSVWSNLYANVGQVYNFFSKSENDLISFNLNTGFDLFPGGSDKGRHSIQFGVIYEQRVSRAYSVRPFGLWRLGGILANNHINGIDTNIVVGTLDVPNNAGGVDVFDLYQTNINEDATGQFYRNVRERLGGIPLTDYVNLSALSPDQMTLDLFSARELIDQGLVSYRGYDYLGNKSTGNVTFDDFFTKRDENQNRTFEVAPLEPIYGAAYIQDKFSYKDIIFRLGVRMDYFDANTRVLRDPYALYDIETAADFYARTGQQQPSSVEDDYKVYVAGEESDQVVAFRREDQWYRPSGAAVSGGNVIYNGGIVYPAYKGREDGRVLDIQDPNFDPETSFEDYTPQINFMPRLAFSFPINESAGFYANYDVLFQRPSSNTAMTALDYFYFNNIGSSGPANNPDLKPVRTINYEIGFKQKVTNTSALELSAYYREMKDLIQNRVYANVPSPINQYEAFGNLDFGTTKGFTFKYDRRRTNNLELTATYTLQFADGSGSDANSSRGLNTRGPIRNLSPLSVDERHRITSTIDYRYQSGNAYDGPVIAGMDVFANAGLNFTAIAVSGRPFTRRAVPTQFSGSGFVGSINGSRMPWTFNLDMRAEKTFQVSSGGESGRKMMATAYFRVQNLLNSRNVRAVYPVTGDPEDDGYIVSVFGQQRLQEIARVGKNTDNFLDAYSWRLQSPGVFLQPRRMYLGLIFNF